MKYKATPTGNKFYETFSTFVEYTYRGYKYEVEYPNSIDYCLTSPKVQHETAQEEIDFIIDNKDIAKENSQVGLDMFFNYIEDGV